VNVVAHDDRVNVIAHVHDDAGKGIAGVVLYYSVTDQTVLTPPSSGWTDIDMQSIGGDNWSLRTAGDDRSLQNFNGKRVWYYIMATDSIGNYDRDPAPDAGWFATTRSLDGGPGGARPPRRMA
jgi:hypothetical protein